MSPAVCTHDETRLSRVCERVQILTRVQSRDVSSHARALRRRQCAMFNDQLCPVATSSTHHTAFCMTFTSRASRVKNEKKNGQRKRHKGRVGHGQHGGRQPHSRPCPMACSKSICPIAYIDHWIFTLATLLLDENGIRTS